MAIKRSVVSKAETSGSNVVCTECFAVVQRIDLRTHKQWHRDLYDAITGAR